MNYRTTTLTACFLFFFCTMSSFAQNKSKTKVTADLVSSYIWRGCAGYSPLQGQNLLAPSIQPTLAWDKGNFELGAWGSSDFTGTYKEVDLFASYTIKQLTFTFTDYYWNLDWLKNNYFDYRKDSTSHILEASLTYKLKKIPLSIQLATMIYGADRKATDIKQNNYSTYLELIYTLPVGDDKIDLTAGMTPTDGYYGDGYGGTGGFAVVNLGATSYRTIKVSKDFEIPLKASLYANPQHQKLYLVIGITL